MNDPSHDAAAHRAAVGYVSGVFDLFHIGHLRIIERARERCDVLVVGALCDQAAKAAKGRAPVVPEDERLEILAALRCVDEVILDPSLDKREAWRIRAFDVLYKGDDWLGSDRARRLVRELALVGARVEWLPYTPHTSSTLIRGRLEDAVAQAMEGRRPAV